MGKDFISGYCQLVTGEKDPRNLRLAFSVERVMLVEFDVSENVEVSLVAQGPICQRTPDLSQHSNNRTFSM